MALTVLLKNSTPTTLNLQANNFRISLKRYPIQNPIPGGDVLLVDLSQLLTTISVSGVISNDQTGSNSADILRQAATSWDILSPTLEVPLQSSVPGTGKKWAGQIESVELGQEAAQDTFFTFTLIFRCNTNSPDNVV